MRHDVAHDERSCLGCGKHCSDPYSFCGKCLSKSIYSSESYFGARLRPRVRKNLWELVFWTLVFVTAGLAYWTAMGMKP